jgi:hypothetical protein
MKTYQIWVNGLPYMGEDADKTYSSGEAWSNQSFHTQRTEVNVLTFGLACEKPKCVIGDRSLKSDLDRIIRRSQDGYLNIAEIRIVANEEEG